MPYSNQPLVHLSISLHLSSELSLSFSNLCLSLKPSFLLSQVEVRVSSDLVLEPAINVVDWTTLELTVLSFPSLTVGGVESLGTPP